jgi:DNA repair exonuclease SbcCD ATPase subunit
MADQKVNIKVSAQGAKKAGKEIGGLDGSIKKLGRSVLNASVAYFGTTGLINGIMKSTELAGIQEQAEKQLEVALGKTSQALLDQASALQRQTTFGDEAIIGVQASISAFIKSEEQIKKATEATLDIAVAMGMDLKSAGDLVAKTLGSSTNAMSRYGIEVKGAVGSTERLESLTGNVAELFGGQAQAQAQTYAGSIEQLKNDLGDMAEGIGQIVIPIFEDLAPHIKRTIDFWKGYISQTTEATESDKEVSEEIKKLNEQIERQANFVKLLKEQTEDYESLRARASQFNTTILDQASAERASLDAQNEKLDQLREKKEQQIEIERLSEGITTRKLELQRSEINNLGEIAKVTTNSVVAQNNLRIAKEEATKQDIKSAIMSGQSAQTAIKSIIRAESMEAVVGLVSSILKSVPFPINVALASGAGAVASGLIDSALGAVKAETGFEGVVTKPTLFLTGENNKPEQVSVVPLGGQSASGITVNISAPLVDETVVDSIIPAIEKAKRMNLA